MKKITKLTAMFLSMLMIIASVPMTSSASGAVIDSGTCGDDLTWTLDEDGTLTISGEGEITLDPWNGDDVKNVVIEEGITSIGHWTFGDCYYLETVTIPSTVTKIDPYAFANAYDLKKIYYSGSLENWYKIAIADGNSCLVCTLSTDGVEYSFCGQSVVWTLDEDGTLTISGEGEMTSHPWNRDDVKNVVIEDGVTSIAYEAFEYCNSLSTVTIPASVMEIGSYAFNSSNLKKVYYIGSFEDWCKISVNSNNTYLYKNLNIGGVDYSLCGQGVMWELDENGTLTISGEGKMTSHPWNSDDIKNVIIENGVTGIGDSAFNYCTSLTSVVIPDSVTEIGSSAFNNCNSLASVAIPDSVTYIGGGSFRNCKLLTEITIPDGVTNIFYDAFRNCSVLKKVTVPNTVTYIDQSAFYGCNNGLTIYYGGTYEEFSNYFENGIDGATVYFNDGTSKEYPNRCGENATWTLDEYGTLKISGEGDITSHPWNGDDVKNVIIEDGITSIGYWSFDCMYLESATIPSTVTKIERYAFVNAYALKRIYYNGTKEEWDNISIESNNSYLTNALLFIDGKVSGECGDNLIWTLDENGTLTVSGVGEMKNYYYSSWSWGSEERAPWHDLDIKAVVIEDGVTNIGEYAFYECSSLASVTIPDSVISIKDRAFAYCSSLASITIGGGVTNIGNYAFSDCRALIDVTIPDSVTSIGEYAFSDCNSLTSVTMPDSVTSIGNYAFSNCSSLASVTIGGGVTSIGSSTFYSCTSLNDIYYGGTYEEFSKFSVCQNLSGKTLHASDGDIIIPDYCGDSVTWTLDENGVLTISGTGAMYSGWRLPWSGRNDIYTVIIEYGVTSIGERAFCGCRSIVSVTIPDSVTRIGDSAFEGCTSLPSVAVPGSVTSITYKTFKDCTSLVAVDIPDGVVSIGEQAFINCESLPEVFIPASVAEIGNMAFGGCASMLNINVDENNAYYASVDGVLFDKELTTIIVYPAGRNGEYTVPDGVKTITANSFAGNAGLTAVHLPSSISSIGNKAFDGCGLLTDVYYSGTRAQFDDIFISDRSGLGRKTLHINGTTEIIPNYCGGNVTWTLDENGTLTISGKGDMYNYGGYGYDGYNGSPWCEETVNDVIIEDGVTSIGNDAFCMEKIVHDSVYGSYSTFSSIKSVDIPDSVTKIGSGAFYYNNLLTEVVIPDSVTSIGYNAFQDCCSLTSVTIPASVTSIGGYAFCNCSSLASVIIPDGVVSLGSSAFQNCSSLTSIIIPDSVTSIGGYAFYNCSSLTAVVIPDGVASLGSSAFQNCSSLTSVTIPASVTSIGYSAFYNCSSLANVYYAGTKEEWNSISISSWGNEPLENATIHYNTKFTVGDIDGDGEINTKDTNMLKQIVLGTITATAKELMVADVYKDGAINTKDIFMLKKMLVQG